MISVAFERNVRGLVQSIVSDGFSLEKCEDAWSKSLFSEASSTRLAKEYQWTNSYDSIGV